MQLLGLANPLEPDPKLQGNVPVVELPRLNLPERLYIYIWIDVKPLERHFCGKIWIWLKKKKKNLIFFPGPSLGPKLKGI